MRVLIVAKTRMGGGACIGALSTSGQSLRLMPNPAKQLDGFNLEYSVGDVYTLLDYEFPTDLTPPHIENVIVRDKRFERFEEDPSGPILKLVTPKEGGPEVLYDGMTGCTMTGALYIAKRLGVPAYSTTFWRPDQPLRLDDSLDKLRYRYVSGDVSGDVSRSLTYVGFQRPVHEIPAGTLVRVSLAHWWRPFDAEDSLEERCYVQLSGWYMPNDQVVSAPAAPQHKKTTAPSQGEDLGGLLKNVFGYTSFRGMQEDVIQTALDGGDALVVMPTGGGKSLCYQLAALAADGITVVVSPLISLMKDQVDALRQLGVGAAYLNSTLPESQVVSELNRIKRGEIKLVYLSPERLMRSETLHLLDNCKLALLAVDEAHCISAWGHDFRPEYSQLIDVRQRYPQTPCLALTATATPRVQQDIIDTLQISEGNSFIGDLNRENLFLSVQHKTADATGQVIEFVRRHENESGIIYCSTKKQVDDLAAALIEEGVSALPYHAGLRSDTRTEYQNRFNQDDVQVMVATIAFGMGIDKSNVRFVVHYSLPESLDSYYQQIGRAGRDGLRADCLLLYDPKDAGTIRFLISQGAKEEQPGALQRLADMKRWAEGTGCRRRRVLRYFGQEYHQDNCGMCDRCVTETPAQTGNDDLTAYARLFLDAVEQVKSQAGFGFGRSFVIDVLRGSKSKKIMKWRCEQIAAHGSGKDLSKEEWQQLVDQFMIQDLIVPVGNFRTLALTSRGKDVLEGAEVRGIAPVRKKAQPSGSAVTSTGEVQCDSVLFARLSALRSEIAEEIGMPPYIIFHDRSLIEMAAYYPQTEEEFGEIYGVGRRKIAQHAPRFLPLIAAYCRERGVERPNPDVHPGTAPVKDKSKALGVTPRTREVAEMLIALQSVVDAADELGIKPVTVFGHLWRYVLAGNQLPLSPIRLHAQVPPEVENAVNAYYDRDEQVSLKLVFERFEGTLSYETLHALRICHYLTRHPSCPTT